MSELELKEKMTDSSLRICHSCNRENLFDAAVCVHCGETLGSITVIVPDRPLGVTRTNYLSQIIRLHEDALVLLIATQDQPIVLKGDGKFLIGRQAENEPPPMLDMTKYGGHTLGVSRRHVLIFRAAEGYMIEDLGSANGSFLNENRLQANKPTLLRNGDLIRLGQLMLFAYFTPPREKQSILPSEQAIWLTEKGDKPSAPTLTLQQLTSQVIPFMNAIEVLQGILDDAQKRASTQMEINQIVFEKDANRIKIALVTHNEVIKLIQDKLHTLRQKHAASLQPPPPNEPISNTETSENITNTAEGEGETQTQQAIFAPQRELAAEILGQIVPSIVEDEKESLIQRLLVPLYTLTTSRFELTTSS